MNPEIINCELVIVVVELQAVLIMQNVLFMNMKMHLYLALDVVIYPLTDEDYLKQQIINCVLIHVVISHLYLYCVQIY